MFFGPGLAQLLAVGSAAYGRSVVDGARTRRVAIAPAAATVALLQCAGGALPG